MNKLTVPGLKTPSILIWSFGLIHGKILKTAAIDKDTGLMVSGYTTTKANQFAKYTAAVIAQQEKDLKAIRAEAAQLKLEANLLEEKLKKAPEKPNAPAGDSIGDKRRQARDRAKYQAKLDEQKALREHLVAVLTRIGELQHRAQTADRITEENLKETAAALRAKFSAFTNGATLKPVRDKSLPVLEYKTEWDCYQTAVNQAQGKSNRRLTVDTDITEKEDINNG